MTATATSTPVAPRATPAASGPAGGEFLTFRLGAEEYAIDILSVQEIRSYEEPTRIANAPAHLRGVVNLRGVVVPVVDLRIRLGCQRCDIDASTVVIVLNLRDRVIGAVVDAVSDVLELSGDALKPAPQTGSLLDDGFITGIGTLDQRMLILVDLQALFAGADMGLLDAEPG